MSTGNTAVRPWTDRLDAVSRLDPRVIWLRAQLLKRWDLERRAQLPLDLMQPIEILASVGAAVLALYWMPRLF